MEAALRFIVYVIAAQGLDRFGVSGPAPLVRYLTAITLVAGFARFAGFTGLAGFIRVTCFSGGLRILARVVFAGVFVAILRSGARIAARIASARAIAILIGNGLLFGEQRFPVGDRNLIVIGVDFAKRQKAVPVSAILDKRSLQ